MITPNQCSKDIISALIIIKAVNIKETTTEETTKAQASKEIMTAKGVHLTITGRIKAGLTRAGLTKKRPPQKQKTLLVNREQLAQIEEMYKKMLPLPNPDAHEVIAQAIGLEPKKVFFGINLIRQKLMLPKISMPKRKLALTPDQLMAIKNLYEPLLPLPPIGCHKILAAQLKMDEWRVHVGIGLVRKQMGLDRWNQEREDAPEEYRKKAE